MTESTDISKWFYLLYYTNST